MQTFLRRVDLYARVVSMLKRKKNRRLHSEIELLPICNAIASHETGIEASAHLCVRVHLFVCRIIYEIEIARNF